MTAFTPSNPRVLPSTVGAVLSRLPAYPGSMLLVTALNLALARYLPADVGQLLRDKRMRVQVRDARVAFDFAWNGQRFAPHAPLTPPAVADVTLSATAHDFLLLAQRQQDPDTLFFSRRLSMEGDTELGLVVKNALDAIELPVLDPRQWVDTLNPRQWADTLDPRQWTPRSVLGRLRQRLGAAAPRKPGA